MRLLCQKRCVISFMVVLLWVGFSVPSPVHAQGLSVPVLDAPNLVQNTIIAESTFTLSTKENFLDSLVGVMGKQLIRQLTQSTVNWINSGFEGKPAFVDNPGRFLTDVGDQITGRFIDELGLGFLCSSFSSTIQLALRLDYGLGGSGYIDRYSCTASAVIDNVTKGQIASADSFFDVAVRSRNNPYVSYLSAKQELSLRIGNAQEIQLAELNWGNGFLSFKDANGNITTPGAVIEGQLNHILGSDTRQLELADEINEILGALTNTLMSQVIQGGLRGVSNGGNGRVDDYAREARNVPIPRSQEEAEEQTIGNLEGGLGTGIITTNPTGPSIPEQGDTEARNRATEGVASQSSTFNNNVGYGPQNGNDYQKAGYAETFPFGSFTAVGAGGRAIDPEPWWEVDLRKEYRIEEVVIYSASGGEVALEDSYVVISSAPIASDATIASLSALSNNGTGAALFKVPHNTIIPRRISIPDVSGRFVRLMRSNNNYGINLGELEVYARPLPVDEDES